MNEKEAYKMIEGLTEDEKKELRVLLEHLRQSHGQSVVLPRLTP